MARHARTHHPPGLASTALRRLARHERDRRAAMRLSAIANALDGFSRAEAARLAGMQRQVLRDAVIRRNAEDLRVCTTDPAPAGRRVSLWDNRRH